MKSPLPALLLILLSATASHAGNELRPLMTVPGEIAYESKFSEDIANPDKTIVQKRQGTRWQIKDGVLLGQPSPAEYQAAKKDHKGLEPRMSVPITPAQCAASFSIRFSGGEETPIVPFVEFGHHIIRLRFSQTEGVSLLADHESVKVAEDTGYRFPLGEWIHIFAELKGTEFVIQIQDGPALYASHPVIGEPVSTGGNGLGVAGTRGGNIEIDDLTLWNVKPEFAKGWEEQKTTFPAFAPVSVRKKPKK